MAVTGARPVGMTDGMNFGNPEKPEVMGQFAAAVDGIREAGLALEVPVTGGNVSFYNETEGTGIAPTPIIGMVGILDDVARAVRPHFPEPGLPIYHLGPPPGGSWGAARTPGWCTAGTGASPPRCGSRRSAG